jgi:hypothetical protein
VEKEEDKKEKRNVRRKERRNMCMWRSRRKENEEE